jgi:two-component system OmpR family sensor kinase
VAVSSLLDTLSERFGGRAERLGRTLDVAPGDSLVVEGDRLRLEQALSNLIDNALRHGRGRVKVWARQGDAGVDLHVSDEGGGFPEDFLPRAFERFSRADSARTDGGSGLGLSIVQAIARAHGGFAAVTNRPGPGADVWIRIPSGQTRAD